MICMAVLPSDTFAYKAQRILTANGYKIEMIRTTTQKDGCIFGIRIYGEFENIRMLLERERIPVRNLRIERDDA
ncbi:MAG: hypothetical protein K2G88_09975 [Oscillospiraceae bacterium]|nr:hypothetical protein [Oscillospiraceae bacterium]MDE6005698.1 hypothetical protein [Oscillospiraceae bacterium]MDE6657996.1 hypothetical protein [Oscillospiraceae bacterium]